MENISESLNTNTLDKNKNKNKNKNLPLEIPLSSCSNIHLFKQLQIFLQQNNIPIEITISKPSPSPTPTPTQTGGRDPEQPEKKPYVYQDESSTFSLFKSVMDRFFLQKQHENTEDKQNKKLLDSIFSKDKSKKEIIHSLQTLSKTISREEESSREKEEPSKIESVIKEEYSKENKKKKLSTTTETNTLYMHIKTNQPDPIESIKGTKLYYLYQRQQNAQCAQFV